MSHQPDAAGDRKRGGKLRLAAAVVTALALATVLLDVPGLRYLAYLILAAEAILAVIWLGARLYRWLLWSVGRRLAFTYFLIGVLPIPLVAAMIFVAAYLLSGFFLGQLFRSALGTLDDELRTAATARLAAFGQGVRDDGADLTPFVYALYRDGVRVAGDDRAPQEWPAWLAAVTSEGEQGEGAGAGSPLLVSADDGETMSVAGGVAAGRLGVLARFAGDLESHLSRRAGIWVDLLTAEDPRKNRIWTLAVFDETFVLQPLRRPGAVEGREEFLAALDPEAPFDIIGFELAGPLYDLATGEVLSPSVSATLTATPSIVRRRLFPSSGEVDTLGWLAFVVPAFLLFDIAAVAALMAIFLIVGLSRAVNRLSRATAAVQAGDFSVRIPVRRRDQLGALQSSFNQMAENLEQLLKTAAKKERLEKELEIARNLQKSLLPGELSFGDEVAFSTYFQPSAAIGGDYYDILPLDGGREPARRLAVVIADVAGHGLSAGLGMAMLKAALLILVEEGREPQSILTALDRLVRSTPQKTFVTATLARVDLDRGRLEITNAGHPPTYLLRRGEVREIALPSTPLGVLDSSYRTEALDLEPGDMLVWLSDGFIEATSTEGECFGYERTREALCGDADTPADLRDRFLDAVRTHSEAQAAADDCTLVVMHYRPSEAGGAALRAVGT